MILSWRKQESLSPLPQPGYHLEETAPLFGQFIFLIRAAVLAGRRPQNAMGYQRMETGSQYAFRQLEVPLEFAEAPHSIECIAKDEHCPSVSNDL
jgi:hypothetical protein